MMRMRGQNHVKTREDDERLLDMLRRRDKGEDSPAIGKRHGMKASAVRSTIARVHHDLRQSEAR